MGLQFTRGRDMPAANMYYKVLVYGHSGAGKTWLAASAPNPIVLLTEQNGLQSARLSNPDARVAYTSSIDDVRDLAQAARSGSLSGVDTIVIDGLTEIQRLFKDEMLAQRGTDEFSIAMWGELTEKMRRLLRLLRDVPYHVVCTALAETEMEGEIRHVFPAFQGKKLYDEVMQYFNLVGYAYKVAKGDSVEHVVMFDGPSRFAAKNCHPVRGTRPGPVSVWISELRGAGDAPRAIPTPAPTPAPEAGSNAASPEPRTAPDAPEAPAPAAGASPGEGQAAGARRLRGRASAKDEIPG